MIKKLTTLLLFFPVVLNAAPIMQDGSELAKECVLTSKKVHSISQVQQDSKCQTQLGMASNWLDQAADNLFLDETTDAKDNLKRALSNVFYAETYQCDQLDQIQTVEEEIKQIQSKL